MISSTQKKKEVGQNAILPPTALPDGRGNMREAEPSRPPIVMR